VSGFDLKSVGFVGFSIFEISKLMMQVGSAHPHAA